MGTAWRFVTVATLILSAAEEISAQITSIRVRSEDQTITVLIAQASEWSPTFRGFVDTIGQSDASCMSNAAGAVTVGRPALP